MQKIRVGFGVDVHRLQEGYEFKLGGVAVPFCKGAVGHSDADVLLHAICDALFGAANLRDIGYHFSASAEKYKGIDITVLLQKTAIIIREKGFEIGNIDCTIALQEPKISKYIPQMQQAIAKTLQISLNDISIKATTTERLGFEGRGEGITAYAVALLYPENH